MVRVMIFFPLIWILGSPLENVSQCPEESLLAVLHDLIQSRRIRISGFMCLRCIRSFNHQGKNVCAEHVLEHRVGHVLPDVGTDCRIDQSVAIQRISSLSIDDSQHINWGSFLFPFSSLLYSFIIPECIASVGTLLTCCDRYPGAHWMGYSKATDFCISLKTCMRYLTCLDHKLSRFGNILKTQTQPN